MLPNCESNRAEEDTGQFTNFVEQLKVSSALKSEKLVKSHFCTKRATSGLIMKDKIRSTDTKSCYCLHLI